MSSSKFRTSHKNQQFLLIFFSPKKIGPKFLGAPAVEDRLNDALNATKAALEEGIVPGGGFRKDRQIFFGSAVKQLVHTEFFLGFSAVKQFLVH